VIGFAGTVLHRTLERKSFMIGHNSCSRARTRRKASFPAPFGARSWLETRASVGDRVLPTRGVDLRRSSLKIGHLSCQEREPRGKRRSPRLLRSLRMQKFCMEGADSKAPTWGQALIPMLRGGALGVDSPCPRKTVGSPNQLGSENRPIVAVIQLCTAADWWGVPTIFAAVRVTRLAYRSHGHRAVL